MCAKPLVSFYEGLFAFAAAFVAAVALGFTVSYKNSIAAVTHPQRGLILCHHEAEHHLQANQQRMKMQTSPLVCMYRFVC